MIEKPDMALPTARATAAEPEVSALRDGIANADRIATALRVMQIFNFFDGPDSDALWWRTDGEYAPVTMMVNCNDAFWWASADREIITAENVEALAEAVSDVMAISEFEVDHAPLLWVCRVRKMRPQGAYYRSIPAELHKLFNAAGPERETDNGPFGNPMSIAQAIEARRAETERLGAKHESAVHAPEKE